MTALRCLLHTPSDFGVERSCRPGESNSRHFSSTRRSCNPRAANFDSRSLCPVYNVKSGGSPTQSLQLVHLVQDNHRTTPTESNMKDGDIASRPLWVYNSALARQRFLLFKFSSTSIGHVRLPYRLTYILVLTDEPRCRHCQLVACPYTNLRVCSPDNGSPEVKNHQRFRASANNRSRPPIRRLRHALYRSLP